MSAYKHLRHGNVENKCTSFKKKAKLVAPHILNFMKQYTLYAAMMITSYCNHINKIIKLM